MQYKGFEIEAFVVPPRKGEPKSLASRVTPWAFRFNRLGDTKVLGSKWGFRTEDHAQNAAIAAIDEYMRQEGQG